MASSVKYLSNELNPFIISFYRCFIGLIIISPAIAYNKFKLLKIVDFSPLATQYTKEAINFGNETPTVQGMKMENDLSSILLSSNDRIQAINSFKNKKSHRNFKGK